MINAFFFAAAIIIFADILVLKWGALEGEKLLTYIVFAIVGVLLPIVLILLGFGVISI
jgi:hypothetical protein